MDVIALDARSSGRLTGLIGIEIVEFAHEKLVSKLFVRRELLAPNGYLHAASLLALTDTTCGYGMLPNFRPDVAYFPTVELKADFIGTSKNGTFSSMPKGSVEVRLLRFGMPGRQTLKAES